MARCMSCSAPLPANTQFCGYCGVRNDVDMRGKHAFTVADNRSPRICPACSIPLQTIQLDSQPPMEIERCSVCFGLFFDPGEVESLLEKSVPSIFLINRQWLENIKANRYQKDQPVRYRKCPVCLTLMNRLVFAHQSGVVIDRCNSHGVWLDGGEISHLLEWKQAGGQLLHQKKQTALQAKKRQSRQSDPVIGAWTQTAKDQRMDGDLLQTVAELIFKLFD